MTPTQILLGVLLVCGAFVPGPCNFDPHREFDCSLGEVCERNFACAFDGYCKSADIACLDGEARCEYPGLDRVGICVREEELQSSKTHCGLCFDRCLGAGVCIDGVCQGAPPAGRCLRSRGNFDCAGGEACRDDGDGDDDGVCTAGGLGERGTGEACDDDDECKDGICEDGVCTRTCDFGCPFGTRCDEEAAPGGICVPVDEEVCR